jgi:esterase/lipase
MTKFSHFFLFLLMSLLVMSCSEKKNNEQITEERNFRSEIHKDLDRSLTSRPVEEVIEIWVKILGERLKFDEKTNTAIQKIYLDAYISLGGSMDDYLDKEKAQIIRDQIIRRTKQDVIKLLNSDQQQLYLRFIGIRNS